MKKIENMNIQEIAEEIGLILVEGDLQCIFNYDEDVLSKLEEVIRKEKAKNQLPKGNLSSRDIAKKLLLQFEDKVDKEALVLLTLYNLKRKIENRRISADEEVEVLELRIKRAIQMIGNRNFTLLEPVYEEGYVTKVKIINSARLLQVIKSNKSLDELNAPNKKQTERLQEIQRDIGWENIVEPIYIEDIQQICTDEKIGKEIAEQVYWNSLQEYSIKHPEVDIKSLCEEEQMLDELALEIQKDKKTKEYIIQAIKQNFRYVDYNKLLLMVGYRSIEMLENDEDDSVISYEYIGDKTIKLDKEQTVGIIRDTLRVIQKMLDKGVQIEVGEEKYSTQSLERDIKRFCKMRYIRKAEIEEAKTRLLEGKTTIVEEDEQVIGRIEFEEGNFTTLIQNSEDNLIFFIEEGIIEKQNVVAALMIRGECSLKLFSYINQRQILNYDEIIELFEEGIINGEVLSSIEDEEILIRLKEHTKNKIIEFYSNNVKEEDKISEDRMESFSKYQGLYKKLNINGKTGEEIADSSFDLISSFEENLTQDVLQSLYQFGIISLESAADWGVNLKDMLSDNSIKPTDLKELYTKGIISLDSIKNVLRDENLSDEEKLDLIYSTFDGESKEEILAREELTGLLGIGEGYKSETNREKTTRGTGTCLKSKEFVTDPHARWKLISLLDKDYSKKFLPKGKEIIDGHRVFLLPNQGKVVIERMHERRIGKRVDAYGSATYIMDTGEFLGNIDEIIIDRAINRTILRELSEEGRAKKIIHSRNWGEAIKRYFQITPENERYTEEERNEIDLAILNVEKSRKERE